MMAFMLVGCMPAKGGTPDYSRVRAYVGQDYFERFDSKGFTLADFDLDNASDFEYRYKTAIDPEDDNESIISERFFFIYLKKKNKRYAQQALDHLADLEFVDSVTFCYQGMNPGKLLD